MRDTLVYRNRLTRFLMALAGALFLGVVAYSAEPSFTAAQREWWSLKPVVKPAVPEVISVIDLASTAGPRVLHRRRQPGG